MLNFNLKVVDPINQLICSMKITQDVRAQPVTNHAFILSLS